MLAIYGKPVSTEGEGIHAQTLETQHGINSLLEVPDMKKSWGVLNIYEKQSCVPFRAELGMAHLNEDIQL